MFHIHELDCSHLSFLYISSCQNTLVVTYPYLKKKTIKTLCTYPFSNPCVTNWTTEWDIHVGRANICKGHFHKFCILLCTGSFFLLAWFVSEQIDINRDIVGWGIAIAGCNLSLLLAPSVKLQYQSPATSLHPSTNLTHQLRANTWSNEVFVQNPANLRRL